MRARVVLLAASVAGVLWPTTAGAVVRLPSTEVVSVDSDERWGTGDNTGAFVSDDGRYVAFSNDLAGLAGGWGAYVRDRVAGTTTALDVPQGDVVFGLSADGSRVGLRAWRGEPVTVLHDRSGGTSSSFAGVEPLALAGDGCHALTWSADRQATVVDGCGGPTVRLGGIEPDAGGDITADGRAVAYREAGGSLVVVDVTSGDRRVVATGASRPSLSADGRVLAYEVVTPGRIEILVTDLATGATRRHYDEAVADGADRAPVLDPTGRWLVHVARRDVALPGELVLRAAELATGRTELISTPLVGVAVEGYRPDVAPGAAHVAFESASPLLAPGDTNLDQSGFGENRGFDVFLRTRGQVAAG